MKVNTDDCITKIRASIDKIDDNILFLLKKRTILVEKIDVYKKQSHLPVIDLKREAQVLKRLKNASKKYRIDANFIVAVYKIIIFYSRKLQYVRK